MEQKTIVKNDEGSIMYDRKWFIQNIPVKSKSKQFLPNFSFTQHSRSLHPDVS